MLNPQNQTLPHAEIQTKKKKKNFKTKKYLHSPAKHYHFPIIDPLYEALNDEHIGNPNQHHFGPWINQEPKPKDELLPTFDKKQHTLSFKRQQNTSKLTNLFQNKHLSKSQQLLSNFNSLTNPNKLQKVSNRNSTYLKVPVWNAFIEERTIDFPTHNPQYFLRKEIKERQQKNNPEINNKRPNLKFVSIGSTEDLNSKSNMKLNPWNREERQFQSSKVGKFHHEYSATKTELLKKIKANAVIYNYCFENENRLTPSLQNASKKEEKKTERKVEKNLMKRKHEIYQKKLNEMELKLVVPKEKSKLVFLSQSQKTVKPTVSKYIFMDLLQMRAQAK